MATNVNEQEQTQAHSSPTYTVYARGTPFDLTFSQISTDSPNYFTAAFLDSDFSEASSRVLRTDRNPQLFALIVEHLSGYEVLLLAEQSVPSTMSVEAAREKDAEYFQLDSLVRKLAAAGKGGSLLLHEPHFQTAMKEVLGGDTSLLRLTSFSEAIASEVRRRYADGWPVGVNDHFHQILLLEGVTLSFGTYDLTIGDAAASQLQEALSAALGPTYPFDLYRKHSYETLLLDGSARTRHDHTANPYVRGLLADRIYLKMSLYRWRVEEEVKLHFACLGAVCRSPLRLLEDGVLPCDT
ncbi:hypothetical protein JCM10213v2_004537 [Rhodosporidiobolus nylandii]